MKDMRKRERKMEREEAFQLLVQGEYGVLATANDQKQPYGIPLSYVVVNHSIYFHSAVEGHKLQNIYENPKVCFSVVGKTKVLPERFSTIYESVIVFGHASVVKEDEEKIMVLKEFVKKYSSGFISEGDSYIDKAKNKTVVVKITIGDYLGKHREGNK